MFPCDEETSQKVWNIRAWEGREPLLPVASVMCVVDAPAPSFQTLASRTTRELVILSNFNQWVVATLGLKDPSTGVANQTCCILDIKLGVIPNSSKITVTK